MFEKFKMKQYYPKVGDTVTVSKYNKNHLGTSITAYAGWVGKIKDVWADNSFSIDKGNGILICPLQKREICYITKDGVEYYVKCK